jgi:hypothetical protein
VSARFALAALALTCLSQSASARTAPESPRDDLACVLSHPVREVDAFDKLPPAVLAFLKRKMDPQHLNDFYIAPRGGDFNQYDVIGPDSPPYWRRFIRAGQAGRTWFVWYEHGGEGYDRMATFMTLDPLGRVRLIAHVSYFGFHPDNPCAITDGVLDGRPVSKSMKTDWW